MKEQKKAEKECASLILENQYLTEENVTLNSEIEGYQKTLGTISNAIATSGYKG